jgi:hypothetical protein
VTDEEDHWCERHREMFANSGIPLEAVFQRIVSVLAKIWKNRPGFQTDSRSVIAAINKISKGKKFCCWLGDEKLQAYLVKTVTKVEGN